MFSVMFLPNCPTAYAMGLTEELVPPVRSVHKGPTQIVRMSNTLVGPLRTIMILDRPLPSRVDPELRSTIEVELSVESSA